MRIKEEKNILPVKKYIIDLERTNNSPYIRSGYLRLDKNENIIGFPREFIDILRKQLNSEFLTTYPDIDPFYEKVANWVGCGRDNIYITAGSDAAIKAVFEVFVEPQDKVAVLSPSYAMFYVYARMFQSNPVEIYYREGLVISASEIIKTIENFKPKLLCLANPNSPTGTVLPQKDIYDIIMACSKQNCIVLLDEAYYLFYPHSAIDLIRDFPQLIIIRTFSKAFGLASSRLGFACAHKDMIVCLKKVRPMYETNAFAIKFAELILANYNLIEEYLKEVSKAKEYLENQLDAQGIHYFKSYTNFILLDLGSSGKCVQLTEALFQKKILVKTGFKAKPLKNCIRITIGSIKQMKYFLKNFKEIFTLLRYD